MLSYRQAWPTSRKLAGRRSCRSIAKDHSKLTTSIRRTTRETRKRSSVFGSACASHAGRRRLAVANFNDWLPDRGGDSLQKGRPRVAEYPRLEFSSFLVF